MNDERPDPDRLLAQVAAAENKAGRGRLKIFFGASAGVGKTYAMLAAAQAAQEQAVPLVIGVIETHGRSDTEAMVQGLPRLAFRRIERSGTVLREFDLDAALAFGQQHPGALILVDELAHSNAPGSRHAKRWQDVEELLAAGIDVWTTLNVQHLDSLNDVVGGITGIRVWETVPDRVFDAADEVLVVDLPPDELLQRLKQGKVYLPQQAERASRNFFRKGNLLALRELALRRTADRVDGEMLAYRQLRSDAPVWPNRESLLACVGAGAAGEKVVRSCARLAAQLGVDWHAVHVSPPDRSEVERDDVIKALDLAESLGATTALLSSPSPAKALVRYARQHNLSRLVLGRPRRRFSFWQPRLPEQIERVAGELDLVQVALPPDRGAEPPRPPARSRAGGLAPRAYLAALAVCALTAAVAAPLAQIFELSNIVMLFLLAVVGVALRYGRGPAMLAAFVGVGLFDFFFVPPRFSFAVSDVQYLVTFAVMLVVALVIGQLTAGLKVQARVAAEREERVRGLYGMARDLSAALTAESMAAIAQRFLAAEFGAKSALLLADDGSALHPLPQAEASIDTAVAQWVFERGETAGRGTNTLPGSASLMLPLKATMRTRGVLVIEMPATATPWDPEQRRILETCASLLALSFERMHYIEVAQHTTVQMESERLRNSLLSAISHDLRTPLAAQLGLVDTLGLTPPPLAPAQAELVGAIRASTLRMNALVNNVLDMARLESGAVRLNRAWQPLEEVVGTALAAAAPVLAGRPVKTDLPADLPLVNIDAVLIERVLVNLLENAVKYTPPGTAIRLSAEVRDHKLELHLDDDGPGLPPGREEAIFDKFERGRKESSTAGAGLGLAICRAIALAHQGQILGQTRAGGGARFTLCLPLGQPPQDFGGETQLAPEAS